MRIEKYNASRLKEFLDSDQYSSMPFVPVSKHRAQSWIQNPRLKAEDIIMYLAFEGEDMVAYRCILPDHHRDIRFGWLSGNWVRPDQRRRGLASRLFEEAFTDWGHQLMYTNYAPESKAVYDKSNRFELYKERPGIRYYQRSSFSRLLGNRSIVYQRSRPLLSLADGVLNTFQDIRIRIKKETLADLKIEESNSPDYIAVDFMEKSMAAGFSIRTQEDFDWITSYPWVIESPNADKSYFFSSVSPRFRNICIKIRNSEGDMTGFLWMVINGVKMTIPYIALNQLSEMKKVSSIEAETREANEAFSRILNYYLQSNRIFYMTSYQSHVINNFQPGPLLGTRKMTQNYFATRDLLKQLPDPQSIQFQDGDGDVVFV
ncbi:GNAT family N-acetyltransferase [Bacteroidota bacterium]